LAICVFSNHCPSTQQYPNWLLSPLFWREYVAMVL